MGKIKILHASVNTMFYDTVQLMKMGFDDAVEFFKNDEIGACSYEIDEIDTSHACEYLFHASGVEVGDFTDTLLVWIKPIK